MFRYLITIFLSAFLLFQVQPLVARLILPQFGGTSAVWTTCLMFFQVALLLGYLYAHLLRKICTPRASFYCHCVLLCIAAVSLRISKIENLAADPANMTWSIVQLLALTVGVPFLALSATGPLIQAWHSLLVHNESQSAGHKTYRLYALSNAGSMLALLSYPFLVEPMLSLNAQRMVWTICFVGFCIAMAVCGWQIRNFPNWAATVPSDQEKEPQQQRSFTTTILQSIVWVLLATIASILLMAITNTMTQEVASFPFLWILPLSLYLLSLIICFDRPAWYRRRIFLPLLVLSIFVAIPMIHLGTVVSLLTHVLSLSAVTFFSAMVCHGELYRLRPQTSRLTAFYLCVALGGGLGGVFVTLLAPRIFNGFYEFQIGLLLCLLVPLAIVVWQSRTRSDIPTRWVWGYGVLASVCATFVACSLAYYIDGTNHADVLFRQRNEYGLMTVIEEDGYRTFVHGQTDHGGQYVADDEAMNPSSYYTDGSGAAVAFQTARAAKPENESSLNVGVIGLGTGALVSWGQPADTFCFYEINPLVQTVAEEYFTYLKHREVEVVIGDGRKELARELIQNGSRKYDLLFIDAFSSDSIPTHLLTSECFDLYWKHLNADGILISHISNKYVDLVPVLNTLAKSRGLTPLLIDYYNPKSETKTRWVLMTNNTSVIESELVQSLTTPIDTDLREVVWTDQSASLAPVLNWSIGIDWETVFNRQFRRKEKGINQNNDHPANRSVNHAK